MGVVSFFLVFFFYFSCWFSISIPFFLSFSFSKKIYYFNCSFSCLTTICKWDFSPHQFPLFSRAFHLFCFPSSLRFPPLPRGPKDILSIPLPPHLRITLPPPFGGPLRANLPTLTASNLSIYTTPSSPTSSTSSPCLSKLLRSKPSFPKTSKRALSFHEPPPRPRSSHSCSHR